VRIEEGQNGLSKNAHFLSFVFKLPGNDEIPTDARHFAQFYPGGPLDMSNQLLSFFLY